MIVNDDRYVFQRFDEAENGEEFKKMEIVFNRGSAGIE